MVAELCGILNVFPEAGHWTQLNIVFKGWEKEDNILSRSSSFSKAWNPEVYTLWKKLYKLRQIQGMQIRLSLATC